MAVSSLTVMSQPNPGRNTPRHSGIPTPGARSGIPMPGSRPRSSTGSNTVAAPRSGADTEAMSRALADAIRANDPGRYSGSDNLSPQFSTSGRRSVAGLVRPPSVASTSSAMSSRVPSETQRAPPARSKTPVSATSRSAYTPRASLTSRPESRASNAGRSLSRAGHEFDVGDAVRIESLGMEGTLQFMGEIEGKNGVWAGVELAPSFAGRGKNDGSVNGIHYFTCAPKCGVFTLPNKLSVGSNGRNGGGRPVSVTSMASSYGGRVTPSISGRATPSHAPAPRPLTTPQPKKPTLDTSNLDRTVTAGSRASKYVGMTAHELGTRTDNPSPTRSASTPQGTPKALRGLPTPRARPSLGLSTPKSGRPLSSMPPPAFPMSSPRKSTTRQSTVTPTLSQGSSETFVDDAGEHAQNGHNVMSVLDMNDKAIQEKIALLMSSSKPSPSPISAGPDSYTDASESVFGSPVARRTPDSSALEARIAKLEKENETLRTEVGAKTAAIEEEAAVLNAAIERAVALEDEKNTALARATELERTHEKALKERQEEVEGLKKAVEDTEKARVELEGRIKEEEQKRTEADALVTSLKEELASKSTAGEEQATALKAKTDEITLLQSRVDRLDTDLQFERRELGQQVDELRLAGQETIALYEERISEMEARRYELEDLVAELEAKATQRAASPSTVARQASTAAEIDNESLREQVSHMQRRLGVLEDQLEDARAQAEREGDASNARVIKAKEGEAAARKECAEVRREMDVMRKEDERLRVRTEELAEALRENAVTLEGARADVEGLRAEVADLEGLKTASAGVAGDATPVETAKDAAVVQLQRELEEARKAAEVSERTEMELHEQLENLEREKAELEQIVEATTLRQTADQKLIAELQERALRQVGSRELLRSNSGRLRTVSSNEQLRAETPDPRRDSVDSDSSKTSRMSAGPGKREQIAGLKHIISGLEEEIRQWGSKCAMLEQENKLLESGTEQLQVAMRRLEATIDDRLGKDSDGDAGTGSDGERIKRIETENELMKTRITEMEQKHARAVLDLNKEISELENLVESKIYREDDLERELERYKEKLARVQRNSSRLSAESILVNGNTNGTIRAKTSGPRPDISVVMDASGTENRCELCESMDHDGMNCPLLHDNHVDDSAPAPKQTSAPPVVSDQWCQDCEEFGHTVENCPSTQDVF